MKGFDTLKLFASIVFDDFRMNEFVQDEPLLAHYTSLSNLESILKGRELWLSNPLLMNDYEEIRFGITHGVSEAKENHQLKSALGTAERIDRFYFHLNFCVQDFEDKELLDTFVFCLSEHDKQKPDGLLSMWRAYGAGGTGAAIVIDTSKFSPINNSPITLVKVRYKSRDQRKSILKEKIGDFASVLSRHFVDDADIGYVSIAVFRFLKYFALTTKDHGFEEELEWRAIYLKEYDNCGYAEKNNHYIVTARGIEPKLKFPIEEIVGITSASFTLENIVDSIILGPTHNTGFALRSMERMLEVIEKPFLKAKVKTSSIPLRLG